MSERRFDFDSPKEATAFTDGLEFACPQGMSWHIPDEDPCVVYVEEEEEELDDKDCPPTPDSIMRSAMKDRYPVDITFDILTGKPIRVTH